MWFQRWLLTAPSHPCHTNRRALPQLGPISAAAPVLRLPSTPSGTPASSTPSKKRKAESAGREKGGASKKEAKRAKKSRRAEEVEEAAAKAVARESKRSEPSQKAAARTPRSSGAGASADGPNVTNSRSARRKAAKRAKRRETKQLSTPAAAPPVSSIAAILAAAAASPSTTAKPAGPLAAAATPKAGGSSSSESSESSSDSDEDDATPRGKRAAKPPALSAACAAEPLPTYPPPPPAPKPAGVVGTWIPTQRSRSSVPAAPPAAPAPAHERSWKELWRIDASVAEAGTPLEGKPVVGAVLAYRVVELTAAMMPQMTELRQGVVAAYDHGADTCTLQLWPAAVQGALERARRETDRRAEAQQAAQAGAGQEQQGEEEWWEEEEEVELPCEPYLPDGTLVTPLQELMDVRVLHAAPGCAGAAGGGTFVVNGTTGQEASTRAPPAPAQGNAPLHPAQSSPAVGGLRVPPTLQRLRGDARKRAGEANATGDVPAAAAVASSVDHWTDMAAALKAKKEQLLQGVEADSAAATTPGIQTRRMAATAHSKTVVGKRTPRSGGIGGILARVRREAEEGEATAH